MYLVCWSFRRSLRSLTEWCSHSASLLSHLKNLRSSNHISLLQSFPDFNVQTIAQTGFYGFSLKSHPLFHIHKSGITRKLKRALRNGEHLLRTLQHNLRIGTVTGTDLPVFLWFYRRLDFKLVGADGRKRRRRAQSDATSKNRERGKHGQIKFRILHRRGNG